MEENNRCKVNLLPKRVCIINVGEWIAKNFERYWTETEIKKIKKEILKPYDFKELAKYSIPFSLFLGFLMTVINFTLFPMSSSNLVILFDFLLSLFFSGIGTSLLFYIFKDKGVKIGRSLLLFIVLLGSLLGIIIGVTYPVQLIPFLPIKIQELLFAVLAGVLIGFIGAFLAKYLFPKEKKIEEYEDKITKKRESIDAVAVCNNEENINTEIYKVFHYPNPNEMEVMLPSLEKYVSRSYAHCIENRIIGVIVISDSKKENLRVAHQILRDFKDFPFKKAFLMIQINGDNGVYNTLKEYGISPIILNENSLYEGQFDYFFRELPDFLTENYKNQTQNQDGFLPFFHEYLPDPYNTSANTICSWTVKCNPNNLKCQSILQRTISTASEAVYGLKVAHGVRTNGANAFELAKEGKFAISIPDFIDDEWNTHDFARNDISRVFGKNIRFDMITKNENNSKVWIFGVLQDIPLELIEFSNGRN